MFVATRDPIDHGFRAIYAQGAAMVYSHEQLTMCSPGTGPIEITTIPQIVSVE